MEMKPEELLVDFGKIVLQKNPQLFKCEESEEKNIFLRYVL